MVCAETYEFPERRELLCNFVEAGTDASERSETGLSLLQQNYIVYGGVTNLMKDCPDFFGLVHPARKKAGQPPALLGIRYIALGHIACRRQSHFLLHRCDHFLGYGQRPALEAIHTLLYHIRDMGKNFNERHEN